MCIDMGTGVYVDMDAGMSVGMYVVMYVDMCVDMCMAIYLVHLQVCV